MDEKKIANLLDETGTRQFNFNLPQLPNSSVSGKFWKATLKRDEKFIPVIVKYIKDKTRFEREVKYHTRVNSCTRIVELKFVDEQCLILEFMNSTLHQKLESGEIQKLSLIKKLDLLEQVFLGLKYIHDVGIIHCDISSSNIMLKGENMNDLEAKIINFGYAQDLSDAKNVFFDKIWYMAPDLKMNEANSINTDIYAFGVVMIEVLSNYLFKNGDDRNTVLKKLEEINVGNSNVTNRLKKLLYQCIELNSKNIPNLVTIARELSIIKNDVLLHSQQVMNEVNEAEKENYLDKIQNEFNQIGFKIDDKFLDAKNGIKLDLQLLPNEETISMITSEQSIEDFEQTKELAKYRFPNEQESIKKPITLNEIQNGEYGMYNILIFGSAASGKTTLLQMLAANFANTATILENKPIPIFISLRDMARLKTENIEQYIEISPKFREYNKMLKGIFQNGRMEHKKRNIKNTIVLLLDGLDECGTMKDAIQKNITKYANEHPYMRVIVTSRISGFKDEKTFSKFKVIHLQPLKLDQQKQFINNLYKEHNILTEGQYSTLCELLNLHIFQNICKTPLLFNVFLNMFLDKMKKLFKEEQQSFIKSFTMKNRSALYKIAIEQLLLIDEKKDDIEDVKTFKQYLFNERNLVDLFLEHLAFKCHSRNSKEFKDVDIEDNSKELKEIYSKLSEKISKFTQIFQNLIHIGRIPLIVSTGYDGEVREEIGDENRLYQFHHLTFQEYLTSNWILRRIKNDLEKERDEIDSKLIIDIFDRHLKHFINNIWFKETLLLLAGSLTIEEFKNFIPFMKEDREESKIILLFKMFDERPENEKSEWEIEKKKLIQLINQLKGVISQLQHPSEEIKKMCLKETNFVEYGNINEKEDDDPSEIADLILLELSNTFLRKNVTKIQKIGMIRSLPKLKTRQDGILHLLLSQLCKSNEDDIFYKRECINAFKESLSKEENKLDSFKVLIRQENVYFIGSIYFYEIIMYLNENLSSHEIGELKSFLFDLLKNENIDIRLKVSISKSIVDIDSEKSERQVIMEALKPLWKLMCSTNKNYPKTQDVQIRHTHLYLQLHYLMKKLDDIHENQMNEMEKELREIVIKVLIEFLDEECTMDMRLSDQQALDLLSKLDCDQTMKKISELEIQEIENTIHMLYEATLEYFRGLKQFEEKVKYLDLPNLEKKVLPIELKYDETKEETYKVENVEMFINAIAACYSRDFSLAPFMEIPFKKFGEKLLPLLLNSLDDIFIHASMNVFNSNVKDYIHLLSTPPEHFSKNFEVKNFQRILLDPILKFYKQQIKTQAVNKFFIEKDVEKMVGEKALSYKMNATENEHLYDMNLLYLFFTTNGLLQENPNKSNQGNKFCKF